MSLETIKRWSCFLLLVELHCRCTLIWVRRQIPLFGSFSTQISYIKTENGMMQWFARMLVVLLFLECQLVLIVVLLNYSFTVLIWPSLKVFGYRWWPIPLHCQDDDAIFKAWVSNIRFVLYMFLCLYSIFQIAQLAVGF